LVQGCGAKTTGTLNLPELPELVASFICFFSINNYIINTLKIDMNTETLDTSGTLFESVSYQSTESLEKFMDSISLEHAMHLIKVSLEYSHSKGLFTMNETEILNRSLRLINKNLNSVDESTIPKSDSVENN
jgi:hypothetical protein